MTWMTAVRKPFRRLRAWIDAIAERQRQRELDKQRCQRLLRQYARERRLMESKRSDRDAA